jgi:excisionase family DNA binding protein
MQSQTPLLTKKQAAKYLNVSDGSIERLMRNGLRYVKVGGLVRFTAEQLSEYLEANARGGAAA